MSQSHLLGVGSVALMFAIWGAAFAEEGGFEMTRIKPDNEALPKVLRGRPAEQAKWLATLRFKGPDKSSCTATIVGERSIVTAAHCIDQSNPTGRVLLESEWINVTCHNFEKYRGGDCSQAETPPEIFGCTADISLCGADVPLQLDGLKYETVNSVSNFVQAKSPIVLLGYGCVIAGGPISEDLQIGETLVKATSKPGVSLLENSRSLEEYIMTENGAALCDGDSGGAAYSSEDTKTRRLVGINSRGNISTTSYLVNTSDPEIFGFLDSRGKQLGLSICGVHPSAMNCR